MRFTTFSVLIRYRCRLRRRRRSSLVTLQSEKYVRGEKSFFVLAQDNTQFYWYFRSMNWRFAKIHTQTQRIWMHVNYECTFFKREKFVSTCRTNAQRSNESQALRRMASALLATIRIENGCELCFARVFGFFSLWLHVVFKLNENNARIIQFPFVV